MKVCFLNVLWIIFTIIGLGFIGFFPATVAMFTIVRRWIKGDVEVPIFKTCWDCFKKNLFKANILGYISAAGGVVLYLDYLLVKHISGPIQIVLMFLLITISFYYVMVVFYVFPVYVHYDIRLMECFKYAFVIGSSYPLRTIYMAFATFVIYFVTVSLPVVFLFFSGSILSLLLMRFTYVAFEKVNDRLTANA
ncbi:YesL family protein [Gracilibacillus sp. D59]|uniref:YesL family protein n=1 Tax=Gracilibacillus sp. D59 TaxID=3457434 RepID=UPI003FCEE608